jgi:hypothetical protein
MQRSLSYQNIINRLLLVGLFIVYISLSSLYLLLPPLLALLFYAYNDALSKHDLFTLVLVSVMLLVFEAEKGFWFGSSIVYFTILSLYVIPKLEQLIQCRICMVGIFIALAYPGYLIFILLANGVFLLPSPSVDWHSGLYMIVEFLLLAAIA